MFLTLAEGDRRLGVAQSALHRSDEREGPGKDTGAAEDLHRQHPTPTTHVVASEWLVTAIPSRARRPFSFVRRVLRRWAEVPRRRLWTRNAAERHICTPDGPPPGSLFVFGCPLLSCLTRQRATDRVPIGPWRHRACIGRYIRGNVTRAPSSTTEGSTPSMTHVVDAGLVTVLATPFRSRLLTGLSSVGAARAFFRQFVCASHPVEHSRATPVLGPLSHASPFACSIPARDSWWVRARTGLVGFSDRAGIRLVLVSQHSQPDLSGTGLSSPERTPPDVAADFSGHHICTRPSRAPLDHIRGLFFPQVAELTRAEQGYTLLAWSVAGPRAPCHALIECFTS